MAAGRALRSSRVAIWQNHFPLDEANHVRAVESGWVTGVARPIHLGRSSHVWDVRIHDDADRLVCVSRVTMAVLSTPMRY
ncbi:MAG: hotdog fold thioesterase [Rhodocyclales bacterium]|nr:hotdog fold thioesterase [Rhodocyclales bacterium]